MHRRLPPLNALRAFEAAARHGSFTRAAAELNVTQAAVSHQVKGLEERLGVTLFIRKPRHLELTEVGRAYLPDVTHAFDALAQATDKLRVGRDLRPVLLTASPSIAFKWLLPRLRRLRADHPELEVRLDTSDELFDFDTREVDLAMRYGAGTWASVISEPLMGETLFPVCAPFLIDGDPPLRRPADLARHVLLHDRMDESWEDWLRVAGERGVDGTRGPAFSHSHMVIQAAIDGMGVALGRSPHVADDLAAGRLARPFAPVMRARNSYWLCYRALDAEDRRLVALRGWLKGEAARTVTTPA
jgi:LysR family glycine cleavage system transcriptional activator